MAYTSTYFTPSRSRISRYNIIAYSFLVHLIHDKQKIFSCDEDEEKRRNATMACRICSIVFTLLTPYCNLLPSFYRGHKAARDHLNWQQWKSHILLTTRAAQNWLPLQPLQLKQHPLHWGCALSPMAVATMAVVMVAALLDMACTSHLLCHCFTRLCH